MRRFQPKISEKNITFLINVDGALSSLHFSLAAIPFSTQEYMQVHMTCIKVVLIYTINPLPCMFYLCLLSANLSLSFSPSHQVTLVSGV